MAPAPPLTTLTAFRADNIGLLWSPDGTKIVFQSGRKLDGTDNPNANFANDIWVINADGTGLTALTKLMNVNCFSPGVWSPDGSKIVFGSSRKLNGSDNANTNNIQNILTMNANGTSTTPLTGYTFTGGFSPAVALSPVWSPVTIGGQFQIAFMSFGKLDGTDNANTNSTFNIWVMNADGSSRTPLTMLTVSSLNSNPAWQP